MLVSQLSKNSHFHKEKTVGTHLNRAYVLLWAGDRHVFADKFYMGNSSKNWAWEKNVSDRWLGKSEREEIDVWYSRNYE